MGGKPRRKPSGLFFIEFHDERGEFYTSYFDENEYMDALRLLEKAEEYAVVDHGEYRAPFPAHFPLWKSQFGFDED